MTESTDKPIMINSVTQQTSALKVYGDSTGDLNSVIT